MSIAAMMFAVNAKSHPLVSGLAGYYKFNGNSNDSLGTNNGIDDSVDYSAGLIGAGAGVYGSMKISRSPHTGNGPFSIFCWVNCAYYAEAPIIAYGDNTSSTPSGLVFGLEAAGNKLQFITGGSPVVMSSDSIPLHAWTQVGVVYNKNDHKVQLYINGSPANAATTSLNVAAVGGTIGCFGTSARMNGAIDELGIWNRTLTEEEINELYNAGNGITYPF